MYPRPKIVFLIPVAPPSSVRNWPVACELFRQTLASIFNSTSKDFCVVATGHEAPDFKLPEDSRFKFLSVNYPIPQPGQAGWGCAVKDKMAKLAAAWDYAKAAWNPHYVMKVDWDDLVSSRLVAWLVSAGDAAGYRISHGWIWRGGSRRFIQRTGQFDRVCGSCLIIRSDLADRTGPFLNSVDGAELDAVGRRAEQEDRFSLVPGAAVGTLLLNDSHTRAAAQFEYLGHRLETVPFCAAIYRIGHGNNSTGQYHSTRTLRMLIGRLRRTRLITARLRKEFMLE